MIYKDVLRLLTPLVFTYDFLCAEKYNPHCTNEGQLLRNQMECFKMLQNINKKQQTMAPQSPMANNLPKQQYRNVSALSDLACSHSDLLHCSNKLKEHLNYKVKNFTDINCVTIYSRVYSPPPPQDLLPDQDQRT